jgi:citrate lyase beta subunit
LTTNSNFEGSRPDRLKSVRRSKLELRKDSGFTFEDAIDSGADTFILCDFYGQTNTNANRETQVEELVQFIEGKHLDVLVKLSDLSDESLSVWLTKGISGIVVEVSDANEVSDISTRISEIETSKDIPQGTFEMDVVLGTAKSIIDCLIIAQSSPRISSLNLDERKLYEELDLPFTGEEDALAFSRGRLIVAARVAKVQAHGLAFIKSQKDKRSFDEHVALSRKLGFAGAYCKSLGEITFLNKGFAPSESEYERALDVIETMEKAFEMGLGAVTLGGSEMIDIAMVRHAENTIFRHSAVKAKESQFRLTEELND